MFDQAHVLQDCLARMQHICMLRQVQVMHLLCQTDTVTCLGKLYASFASQHIVSIKSLC